MSTRVGSQQEIDAWLPVQLNSSNPNQSQIVTGLADPALNYLSEEFEN